MRFDLVDLHLFVAVADSRSITQGAARCNLALASASARIKGLEEALGVALLTRGRRGVAPTAAGENLLGHAREILDANDRAVLALNGDVLAGPVRLGVAEDFAESLLSGVLADFSASDPDANVQVRAGGSVELLELMQSGQMLAPSTVSAGQLGVPSRSAWRSSRFTAARVFGVTLAIAISAIV